MKTIVFATENPGKIHEVYPFAQKYGYEVLTPRQAGLQPVEVEETGTTYEENARLKVESYIGQAAAKDLVICGDDTGVEILALNNEPGLHTRRWLGYRMSDDEVIGYALGRLHRIGERAAMFKSTVAYSVYAGDIRFATGALKGHITETPMPDVPHQEGIPFQRIFMVDGQPPIPLWKFHELELENRQNILTHRQQAFSDMFEALEEDFS